MTRRSTRTRVLRLYRTFSTLDPLLIARALGMSRNTVNAVLSQLRREGRVLRARRQSARRPRAHTEYHREVR